MKSPTRRFPACTSVPDAGVARDLAAAGTSGDAGVTATKGDPEAPQPVEPTAQSTTAHPNLRMIRGLLTRAPKGPSFRVRFSPRSRDGRGRTLRERAFDLVA